MELTVELLGVPRGNWAQRLSVNESGFEVGKEV